jgi:outer membrane protein
MRKTLLATLLASAMFSLNAQAVDLLQTYQQALTNDTQYASARSTLTAAQERIPQARAGLLPNLSAGASSSHDNSQFTPAGTSFVARSKSTSTGYEVTLTQPLFNWTNWVTYQQSKLSVAGSEAQFAQAQLDLIIRTAQGYFDVLTAEDALEFTRAQKVATTEQLASAKRNFEVGTQTITDTHEAQAAYDLVVSQEFAAINDLDNKRTSLQAIIGHPPTALAPLKAGVTISPPQPANIDTWVSTAEKQNYSVIGSQISLETAKREIAKDRAGHYPTVSLDAKHTDGRLDGGSNQNGVQSSSGSQTSNSIAIQVSIPLFSGFSVTSKVREAIALEDKARHDLDTALRNATYAARVAYLGVNSGLAQVKALEAAEVSSQSSLDSNKLGYQVGVRINIDVLNAQRQLFSTRKDLAKARYDTIMNGLRLKSAAGSLKEDDLVAVNNLLQK